jgi:ATP-binding cassette, subfamily B, multidrug efflux pump
LPSGPSSERFEERNLDWLKTSMQLAVVRAVALPLLVLAGGISMVALITIGGPMVLAGALTVGELAAFTALLAVFLPPLRSLGWMMSVIQRGRAALERVFELMDAPVDRPEGDGGPRCSNVGAGPGDRDPRDLELRLPGRARQAGARQDSRTIPAGAVVGLFGRTGSGKSTLLRVFARLYNPPAGTVFVDGVDLRPRPRRLAQRPRGGAAAAVPVLGHDRSQHRVRRGPGSRPGRARR